jgi:hypothetical protein
VVLLAPDYVTKDDCEHFREEICGKIEVECDGVKSSFKTIINDHDVSAKQICLDIKYIERTLRATSDIVQKTAILQQASEARQTANEERLWKLIFRLVATGTTILMVLLGARFAGINLGL